MLTRRGRYVGMVLGCGNIYETEAGEVFFVWHQRRRGVEIDLNTAGEHGYCVVCPD